jgi:hypothetical protein
MTEDTARYIDSACKIIATAGLLIGGAWAVFTYLSARQTEARTAAVESKKPFLSKRLEVYSNIVDLASQIKESTHQIVFRKGDMMVLSTLPKTVPKTPELEAKLVEDVSRIKELKEKRNKAESELLVATSGLSNIVSDKDVQSALDELAFSMRSTQGGLKEDDFELLDAYSNALYKLTEACRKSIAEEWQVEIPPGIRPQDLRQAPSR